jgi:hypothetical protein
MAAEANLGMQVCAVKVVVVVTPNEFVCEALTCPAGRGCQQPMASLYHLYHHPLAF